MQAALLKEIGNLTLQEIDDPFCFKDEIIIKVKACGICRTDMKALNHGQRDLVLPRILGHEIAGTIVEKGKNVTQYQLGDRVQVSPGIPCGKCSFCLAGEDHLCDNIQIIGFHHDGGFAEYLRIPAAGIQNKILNIIPNQLTYEEATFAEPLACSINLLDEIEIQENDTVVIFGGGPLGIINAKLAALAKAKNIILIEKNQGRRQLAKNYPFTHIFDPHQEYATAIKNISKNKGADVVIPCCPSAEAMTSGLDLLRKRGRFAFFSGLIFDEKEKTTFDINLIHYKELIMKGVYGCGISHNQKALDLMATDKLDLTDMISSRIGLKDVSQALANIKNVTEMKSIIHY